MDKLLEIYDEGFKEHKEGALRMICSQKENKMSKLILLCKHIFDNFCIHPPTL